MSKKLNEARNDYEDLKDKFNSLKRNYESVSAYAAKDNVEFKKIKDLTDNLRRANEELKESNSRYQLLNKKLKEEHERLMTQNRQ